MKHLLNKTYTYEVWGTTLIVPPIIVFLVMLFGDIPKLHFDIGVVIYLIYIIGFGALLSLPSLFIYRLAFKELTRSTISLIWIKLLLSCAAIICILATFYFFNKNIFSSKDTNDWVLLISYCVTIVIAGQFFNITETRSKTANTGF
jgi:hypothetical protein